MKKFAAVLLSLIIIASSCIMAFADLGAAEFDNWYVVCGMDGFDFNDYAYDYEKDIEYNFPGHVKPGIKLQVHSFDSESKKYLLICSDENFEYKGNGFVNVTEAELNSKFIDATKTISKEKGEKLEKEVETKVTSDTGIVLRQGPSTNFKAYTTIPTKAKITYQYTYKYDGCNWGYVTYKGQSGWACIDYSEEITTTTTTTTTTTATEITTAESETESVSYSTETVPVNQEDLDAGVAESFTSNTRLVIIICCAGAFIIAITAIVILLIVKKKKDEE